MKARCRLAAVLALAVSATTGTAAAAPVHSPSAADYAAISKAYHADRRLGRELRAHSRIIEIREKTVHGRLLARVVFTGTGGHARAASTGAGGWGEVFSAFYFKPTGEWKPDANVSRQVMRSMRLAPGAWKVRYIGSGTETKNGSSPGDVADNPYCHAVPAVEKSQSQFSFQGSWTLNVNSVLDSGVGWVKGTGSYEDDQQDGCINDGGQPVMPQPPIRCSVTFKDDWPDSNFYGQLSGSVDSHANHELRVRLPGIVTDPPTCSVPEQWEGGDGPVLYEHSILVPDARLARDASFTQKVGFNGPLSQQVCLLGYANVTCSAQLNWSATISFKPLKLPKLKELNFSGPAPPPSETEAGNGSRG